MGVVSPDWEKGKGKIKNVERKKNGRQKRGKGLEGEREKNGQKWPGSVDGDSARSTIPVLVQLNSHSHPILCSAHFVMVGWG